jgi:hypothetical protein
MRARYRNAKDTRWLYRLEDRTLKYNRFANADRPMGELRKIADRVWAAEAPAGRRKPTIRGTDGVRYGGKQYSFCAGFTDIVLARAQRNVLVLLHEITHALGPCVHGEKFIRLYFRLLHKYGGFHRVFLQTIAAERGISL